MSEAEYFIKDVQTYMNGEKSQRMYNKGAMKDRMRFMKQDDLIDGLAKLNLQELRYCMGCGIPGTANTAAIELIRARQSEYDKFMDMQSRRLEHEAQKKETRTGGETLQHADEHAATSVTYSASEGEKDSKQTVHPSES